MTIPMDSNALSIQLLSGLYVHGREMQGSMSFIANTDEELKGWQGFPW